MRISIGEVDGNTWQAYCERLLLLKYSDYQPIPAKFGGDLGLEGYTAAGLAFQCYCPDGETTATELYEKQRNKITRNINDLIANEVELIKLLGATKIKEWQFLTPKYESRQLLVHCQSKKNEVLAANCKHIDPSFHIYIKNEDAFIQERQKLIGVNNKISPPVDAVSEGHVIDWIQKNDSAYKTIDEKLARILPDDVRRRDYVEKNLKNYLVGSSMLEKVRNGFPEYYESIMKIKAAQEAKTIELSAIGTDNNGAYLKETMEKYEQILSESFGQTIDRAVIQWLTRETISDWLLRCPLNFY